MLKTKSLLWTLQQNWGRAYMRELQACVRVCSRWNILFRLGQYVILLFLYWLRWAVQLACICKCVYPLIERKGPGPYNLYVNRTTIEWRLYTFSGVAEMHASWKTGAQSRHIRRTHKTIDESNRARTFLHVSRITVITLALKTDCAILCLRCQIFDSRPLVRGKPVGPTKDRPKRRQFSVGYQASLCCVPHKLHVGHRLKYMGTLTCMQMHDPAESGHRGVRCFDPPTFPWQETHDDDDDQ